MSAPKTRPAVLICNGAYWPGNDASGVNQSVPALAQALHEEFDFRLLARDRAFGAAEPVVEAGAWRDLGFAKVRYCTPGRFGVSGLLGILRDTPYDLLILNGFFDRDFTVPALVWRRLRLVPNRPVIVSPRGEFSPGALSLKAARKANYLQIAHKTGLLRNVTLHATSATELADIRSRLPYAVDFVVAENLRAPMAPRPHRTSTERVLRVVFLGRITQVKNVDFALRSLALVRAPAHFSLYGPIEDSAYWMQCQSLISALPPHLSACAMGQIAAEDVPEALANADLFFLPSKSENFGHAIFEALTCGVPVLIGDQTPWRGLAARQAGWDLPLSDPSTFASVIDQFAAMNDAERTRWRAGAARLAAEAEERSEAVAQSRAFLRLMVTTAPRRGLDD